MSNTRRAKSGGELRQERFASSRAYRKDALLGNLVAKRCTRIESRDGRELIYFLHDLSGRETRDRHPTCNLFPAWPWPSSSPGDESAFARLARELHEFYPDRCDARAARALPDMLKRLCLDPEMALAQAAIKGCADAAALLLDYKRRFEAAALPRLAMTETARLVFEVCDYALSQRGMTLALGTYRTGKSIAAQTFAQSNLGRCRYVQLSSSVRDEGAFCRDLGRALGVSVSGKLKTHEIRNRIEATLREQHLALIIDEADYVLPQKAMPETPHRLNWIMTALVNQGVPVVLIGSRNFTRILTHLENKLPTWGSEQFRGRLRLERALPDRPARTDLELITTAVLPDGSPAMRLLLLGHALRSRIPVAAIESAAARARWFASEAGRKVCFEDIEQAMAEAGTLPDSPPPPASAAPARRPREPIAHDPLHSRH